MRTASACPCSLAIRAPAEAVATGRLAFPCAEPLTPRGSQLSSECGLEVISGSSHRSSDDAGQGDGKVVHMQELYTPRAVDARSSDDLVRPRLEISPSK